MKIISLILILTLLSVQITTYAYASKPTEIVSVTRFGAVGDGYTDDSVAIQNAIDYAATIGGIVYLPRSSSSYLILSTLMLRSDLHIIGYGAELFMPSHERNNAFFNSEHNKSMSNVTVEGLTLRSVNDQKGRSYASDSLTSNVNGFILSGVENIRIRDVKMYDLWKGLNIDEPLDGLSNDDIYLSGIEIYNSRVPLIMNTVSGFVMRDSILDATGSTNNHLHSAYIDYDCDDLLFDGVVFQNSPGAGVQIYNGYSGKAPASNVEIRNCSVVDSRIGITVYSGAKDITISNVDIRRTDLAFNINDASNVLIDGVSIAENTQLTTASKGAFNIKNMYESTISDVSIDCKGMKGIIFDIHNDFHNVMITGVEAVNISDLYLFNSYSDSNIRNLILEESTFKMNRVTGHRIRIRGEGSTATIRNNNFINEGVISGDLIAEYAGTTVVVEDNYYYGFDYISSLIHMMYNLNVIL